MQIIINNEHNYVNNDLFFKIRKNKSKNAEFSSCFSKIINQLNEILFAFELNTNVYFYMRINVVSIAIAIFEIVANYIYNSKKKISIFSNKSLESKKKTI